MMRLLPAALLAACVLFIHASGLSAQEQADAVVLSHEESFTMQSANSGVYRVSSSVLVNNEHGVSQARVLIYTDSFRSLGSFKAEIEEADGRKTKAGKKELVTVSISSGLADDSYVSAWEPTGRYPYTVKYEYTVNNRDGIISFPVFSPLSSEKVKIEKATYRLDLPQGLEIISYSNLAEELPLRNVKGRDLREWQVTGFQPVVSEHFMPDIRKLLPLVLCAPSDFSYAGTRGSQHSWEAFGAWLGDLQYGMDKLPESTVAELQELTAGCSSDLEKLRLVYNRLRKKTRYVAIMLGIGKLRPVSASEVEKTGFGDCKALSNYKKAMLKAVGIESSYYIISTRNKDLLPGFTSGGQMDHAMLAVPLPELGDTVFVECTNPRLPLGYRHEDAAGHEILLVGKEGGKLARIGAYPDSLSRKVQYTEVFLEADGSASLSLNRELYLDYTESYTGFEDFKQDAKENCLTLGMKLQADNLRIESVSDNFDSYDGRNYCPQVGVKYSCSTKVYANASADRLFVPVNPMNKGLSFKKGTRQNDIVIPYGSSSEDIIRVHIPDGYEVESLPGNQRLDTEWATFVSESSLDGDCVCTVQSMTWHRWSADKSRYTGMRDFARAVNRCYDASFVLRRK